MIPVGAKVEFVSGERYGVRGRVVFGPPLPTGRVWVWFVGRTEPEVVDVAAVKVVPEPRALPGMGALSRALDAIASALGTRTKR